MPKLGTAVPAAPGVFDVMGGLFGCEVALGVGIGCE